MPDTKGSSEPLNRVLILETSVGIRQIIVTVLRMVDRNVDILVTGNPSEALSLATEKHPALVIVEGAISDSRASGLLQMLRQVGNNTPAILVAPHASQDMIQEAVKVGFSHYILRPFDPKVLLEKVKGYLKEEIPAAEEVEEEKKRTKAMTSFLKRVKDRKRRGSGR